MSQEYSNVDCASKVSNRATTLFETLEQSIAKFLQILVKKTTEKCYKYLLFTGKCKFVMCISSFFFFQLINKCCVSTETNKAHLRNAEKNVLSGVYSNKVGSKLCNTWCN